MTITIIFEICFFASVFVAGWLCGIRFKKQKLDGNYHDIGLLYAQAQAQQDILARAEIMKRAQTLATNMQTSVADDHNHENVVTFQKREPE